ncbi:hypothetical protein BU23DRAFT_508106 [Bimuria novae-zelandiae CBS 107.79]|uniref:DUF1365-domain-containing protein n=1 Tax=Bimuria novae-zelandiae CBS 107.79 TaxID=1447943 RepID=A0A6A5V7W9_9PLEO|nr:hypothetical protein BU23DRAFT_508106 [Bimuria novae-zelandiae CBS 107.79]
MKTAANNRVDLLSRLVLVSFSVVPCAIAFGRSAWPFYATWAVLGGVRVRCGDRKVLSDCVLFAVLAVWALRESIVGAIIKRSDKLVNDRQSLAIGVLTAVVALAASWHVLGKSNYDRKAHTEQLPAGTSPWTMEHPRPFIIPCRTTHTRIFPKKHSFGYDYLLCGFPIVPCGTSPDGVDLIDGSDMVLGRWWLRIYAEDYLTRGQASLGFYGKLKVFLREKGVEDSEWSYAYLVTAPRFFGYSFNPASFWYIYNRDHQLTRMITEVNNTFGERHIYLLDGSSPTSPPQTPDEEMLVPPRPKTAFADYWTKEFHVSPFNSRKGGGYALKALQPFPSPTSSPTIDITITLKSSKDHSKLVARLFSVAGAQDLEHMGLFGIMKFIAAWGWVGFMTFPRILKEAYVLYFRRGLHVWFRPEVLASSIGRLPSQTECFLQQVFRDYLYYVVHFSTNPFHITYETAIPAKPKDAIATTHRRGRVEKVQNLYIQVTTGAFYSRFVHYAHTWEALDRECLITEERNRTLRISQPTLLPLLLPDKVLEQLKEDEQLTRRSYLDELRWTLLRKLRCPPAEPAYPISPKSVEFKIDDIREHSFSEMDRFVRTHTQKHYAGAYRRAVTKLLLAQRYALGFTGIIDFMDLCLRVVFCWVGVKMTVWRAESDDLFHGTGLLFSWAIALVSLSLCHVYGLAKGYI